MMKEKWERTKQFVADHKAEIAMYGITAASVIGLVIVGKKLYDMDSGAFFETIRGKDLEKPDFNLGKIEEFWQDPGVSQKTMIINDIKVGDMGRLGEQFLKIKGVTNETDISAIIGLDPAA